MHILSNLPMKNTYNTVKASDINNLLAKSEKKENKVQEVYVQANAEIVKKAEKIASAMAFARNLANEPAQFATPTELANIACDFGLDTVVYNKEE